MAAIEREDVERVARLARLALTEEEKALFQEQLGAILEHVRALQEVDTEGVEPTPYAVQLTNVLRPDRARPSMPREQARSEEHTSELQSRENLVCRLLLE